MGQAIVFRGLSVSRQAIAARQTTKNDRLSHLFSGGRCTGRAPPAYNVGVHLSIETDREDDGRWIAEALELPGVMTYGQTREEAISNTERLAIEVIADSHQARRAAAVGPQRFVSGA